MASKVPEVDWDNFNPPSKYTAPPPALGPDGRSIVYDAKLPKAFEVGEDKEGFLEFMFDPIVLVGSGYQLRFNRASVALFKNAKGKEMNVNRAGTLLRSAQVQAKPRTEAEYKAAMEAAAKRGSIKVTIDWYARNKDTGEVVQGYAAFPDDPERPGQKKAVLRRGDTYSVVDRKGNVIETKTVESEILFANGQIRSYIDPTRQKG